ncbi:MAG: T9SS type A sorting domain-containing protein [Bacteroidota bacterium]
MKKFTFLIAMVVLTGALFAQWADQPASIRMDAKKTAPTAEKFQKEKELKAAGDTLYYFDMSNAANWNFHHVGSSIDWVIEDSDAAGGTALGDALGTLSNCTAPQSVYDGWYFLGFDLIPPIHDAYLEYVGPALDFTGVNGVLLQYRQWYRAFNDDRVDLEISTNGGTNWTTVQNDLYGFLVVNTNAPTPYQVNLTTFCANQSNVKFRFHFYCDNVDVNYGGGYGWILDNIAFVEAFANEVELTNVYPNFSWINWQGTYRRIPGNILADTMNTGDPIYQWPYCPMPGRIWFGAKVQNNGVNTATNISLDVTVTDGGGGGTTYYSSSTITPIASLLTDATDSLGTDSLNPFIFNDFTGSAIPLAIGGFDINFSITSGAADELPANNSDVFSFAVTDTVYAIDNNPANPSGVTPGSWASGGNDGDIFGVSYDVWINNCCARTMSVFIDGSTTFDVSGYSATIRGILFVSDGAGGYTSILSSDVIDIVDTMADTWLHIPFFLDGFSEIIPAETYLAGIEIVAYNGQEIRFGEDNSSPQAIWATMWNFYSEGTWYALSNYSKSPMIRLNLTNLDPVDVHDINGSIASMNQNYPNPFSEVTELSYSLNTAGNVIIEVTDLTGKAVMVIDEGRKTAGTHFTQISANELTGGIYYYTLKAGDFKETRKMVVVK